MINAETLNEKMLLEYEANPNERNFTLYVMSELLTPIEDFYHVMDLIEGMINKISDDRLLYIASYLSTDWRIGRENIFLKTLNSKLNSSSDSEKAIIYYLNAYDIDGPGVQTRDLKKYKYFLEQSIKHSANMRFANNRLDLARIVDDDTSQNLLKEARNNVQPHMSIEELRQMPDSFWLDIQNWIDEHILGLFRVI